MLWLEYTDDSSVLHRQEFRYSGDDLLAEQKIYKNGSLIEETRFIRDGMLVLQERDGSNTVVREYTWGLNLGGGIGGLLELRQGGQHCAYLYDGNGNVEAVLDAAQNVVAGYRYDPFGVLLNKTGSFEQPYGFSTKRYDEQTGLINYGLRFYDPSIARWTTRDPLGESDGMNLYAFVGNNPVNWVDPWGLMTGEIVWRPVIEGIKIKLPSLALGTVASGVLGGLGGVIGNMIFPTPVGEGSDVIPLPINPFDGILGDDACDLPDNVIPLPRPYEEEIDIPLDLPPGGDDGGRNGRCNAARMSCFFTAAIMNDLHVMDLCEQSYLTCKATNLPVIFPGGIVVMP